MWIKHCTSYQEMYNLLTDDALVVKNSDFCKGNRHFYKDFLQHGLKKCGIFSMEQSLLKRGRVLCHLVEYRWSTIFELLC